MNTLFALFRNRALGACLCSSFFLTQWCFGVDYVITTTADLVSEDGKLSLREAISAANDNTAVNEAVAGSETETDRISFDVDALQAEAGAGNPIVITLDGTELQITDELDIEGPGRSVLTLDANDLSRHFYAYYTTFTLSGLSLVNGYTGSHGGSINVNQVDFVLSDVWIDHCQAYQGGAIKTRYGSATISSVEITHNTASYTGGGLSFDSSTVVLSQVAITDNTGYYGGAFVISNSDLTLRNTTIAGNDAHYSTGGIYGASAYSSLSIENSIFADNGGNGTFSLPTTVQSSILADGVVTYMQLPDAGADGTWDTEDDVLGDYRLQSSSVGVDMGDNSLLDPEDLSDAEGNARTVNKIVDIGAYELQTPPTGLDKPSAVVTVLNDTVDSTDGDISLPEAVAYAALSGYDNHTVTFDSSLDGGTLYLTEPLSLYGRVTIQGPDSGLTLDAGDNHQVVSVEGIGSVVSLIGLTLTNGNSSSRGGGIGVTDAELTLSNCSIIGNQSTSYGGGIGVIRSTVTLENTLVSGNTATSYSGGGIAAEDSYLTIQNCTIENNFTHSGGGAIYYQPNNLSDAELYIGNSLLRNNSAYSNGGGIYLYKGHLRLNESEMVDNTSTYGSGAIYRSYGDMTISQSTIAGNTGRNTVGAFDCSSASGEFNIDNSIIAGNAYFDLDLKYDNPTLSVTSSLIGLDPGFVDAENGDYSLAPHSPAIGRGTGSYADIGAHPFVGTPSGADEASAVVTTLDDTVDWQDGETSLREAIFFVTLDGLNDGMVTFDPTLGEGRMVVSSEVSIYGSIYLVAPEGGLTFDAEQQGRIFNIPAVDSWVNLEGFTLTGASNAGDGGAIRIEHSSLNLYECALLNNEVSGSSFDGGAIYAYSSSLTLSNCQVDGNRSVNRNGGAIYAQSTTVDIADSTFSSNESYYSGGAIYAYDGEATVTLNDTVFQGNQSNNGLGGAIYTPTITAWHSVFEENEASTAGALYVVSSNDPSTLYQVYIHHNRSTHNGGGAYFGSGNQTLSQTLIAENIAEGAGGGIYKSGVNNLKLVNSTVAGNLASGDGAGIWIWQYGSLTLQNSVVAANVTLPTDASDIYDPNTTEYVSSFIGVDDGEAGFVLAPTAGEDGIWDTDDDTEGDYHPLALSSLHNTGDDAYVTEDDLDLDGYPRVRGASVDKGAYERTQLAIQDFADQITEVNLLFELSCAAVDADIPSDNIVVSWSLGNGAPVGAFINSETGLFSWTPTVTGTYTITVQANDGSVSASKSFNLTVAEEEENWAPVIQPISDQTIPELTPISFSVQAEDPNYHKVPLQLALSSSTMPSGVSFDAESGAFSWTPSEAQGPGEYTFTVTATELREDDESPLSSSIDFTLSVLEENNNPVLTLPTLPATINEQETFSFMATVTDDDLPGNPLTFWLENAPAGASIDRISGEFNWTPTEAQGPASYTFNVKAFDGLSSHVLPVSVDVAEINRAPTLSYTTERTVQGIQRIYFYIHGSDPDINEGDRVQQLSYTLSGPQVPSGATISSNGFFDWTPTDTQVPGSYTFDVTVSDGEYSVTKSQTIHAILPPDLTVSELDLPSSSLMEGQALRLRAKVSNLSSGDMLQNPAIAFYVDGTLMGTQSIAASSLKAGQYAWVEQIWYATPGIHTVNVWADYNAQVLESDESNNTLSEDLGEIGTPDLAIANAVYTPEEPVGGSEVEVSATVSNLGGSTAHDVPVIFSLDGEIVDQSILHGPFLFEQTEIVTFNWVALPGDHVLELSVDPDETIAELERANNQITLDLTGVEDTLPPVFDEVVPGEGQRISGTFSGSMSASDQSSLGAYLVELRHSDSSDWIQLYEGSLGAFSFDSTAYGDGEYLLRISLSDSVGNLQQLTRIILIDNTAPDALVLSGEAIEFGASLSWEDSGDVDFSYARIFRSNAATGPFEQIGANLYGTEYTDQAVTAGSPYYYLVRSYDQAGNVSADSNIISLTPLNDQSAPVISNLSPDDESAHTNLIELSVSASDNVGITNAFFEYIAEPSGAYDSDNLSWILLQEGTELSYDWDVSSLETDRYLVRVRVKDAVGHTSQVVQTYLVDHKAPDSVGTISVARRELELAVGWSMPMDSDISGFRISRQADGGEFVVLKELYTSTLYVDSHLQGGVLYAYRVEALDDLGQQGEASFSTPVSALDDSTDPILVELSPEAYSRVKGEVALSLKVKDNDAIANGEFWYRAKGDLNWTDSQNDVLVSWQSEADIWLVTGAWDTTTLGDGEYEIWARATDRFGNSVENTYSLIVDTVAPESPSGLSVSDRQTGLSAALAWNANAETDLATYRIYRRLSGTTEWTLIEETTAIEYVDESLVSENSYEYALAAVDEAGNESVLTESHSVAITSVAEITLQRVAFVPKNPTLERSVEIEGKLFNDGPARAQVELTYFVTVEGVETQVGRQLTWINGGETSYITTPWIPQNAGLTEVRVLAETIAPAVDADLTDNEMSLEMIVNEAPVAVAGTDFSCDWYTPVTFDGSGSSDPDGRIMEYVWDFGDGTTARGAIVTHKYDSIGTHTATLTVTDERSVSSTHSILVNVSDTRADLEVSDIQWSPGEPQEGDEITITAKIKNIGRGPTKKSFFAAYYIDGIYNGYVIVDELIAPGETAEAVVKWLATKGLHTVKIVADDLVNSVNETNEANNERQVNMTFQQILFPDLQISGFTCPLPASIDSQTKARATVDILNAGTADAANVFVALYLNGEMISRKPIANLVAGDSYSTGFDITLSEGEQVLTALVDGPTSLVLESDESNNSRTLDLGDLTLSYPDLALSLQVLPEETELAHRSWIDMQATVHNDSTVDLQETAYVVFYADGVKVGSREIRYLGAGARETVAFQVPATEGVHDLRVVVNEGKSIVESDYSNNEQSHTTDELSIIYSDLAISNIGWFRADGAAAAYGKDLAITFDVSNLSLVSSFDKTAIVLRVDGEEINRMEIGSIRGYDTVSTGLIWESVELDPNESHEVSIMVDPDNLIPEEDEDNNLVIADMPLDLEDGLILAAEVDHPDDDYFGIPLYFSRETCQLTAKVSRASAPEAWLDNNEGRSMTATMIYSPGAEIQQDGSVIYPDPVNVLEDEPMIFDALTGDFKLAVSLEAFEETGNYSLTVEFSDGTETRSQRLHFLVVQDCNFSMTVAEEMVVAGEKIHIEGQVLDLQDMPMAGETVLLSIYQGSDGFGNTMNPVLAGILGIGEDIHLEEVQTDLNGNFSYEHRTLRGQAGHYTIKANVISSIVGAEAIGNYEVLNAGFGASGMELTIPKNYSVSESVTLDNKSERALTNVQVALVEDVAADGLDVRLITEVPTVLSAGASIPLSVVFDADEEADDYAEYTLVFTCAEGIERSYTFKTTLKDSVPSLQFEPSLLELALNPGDQLFRSVTVVNEGLGTLSGLSILGTANLPWVTIANPGLNEVGPNEAFDLELMIEPDAGTQLGIYRDYLTIEDEDGLRFQLPIQVELTSSTRGGVTFIIDNNGGQWVEDAEVRLVSQSTYPVMDPDGSVIANRNNVFILQTDELGQVTFEDLPTGKYDYSILCSGHATATGVVEIMPASLPVVITETLEATPITYEWSVTPVVIEDRYEITLNIEMNLNGLLVPGIVTMPPWATIAQDVQTGYNDRIVFKNVGDFALYDVQVNVVSETGLEDKITLAGNGDIGTVASDETIYLSYYVSEGDYSDVQGSRFEISGYYVMTTDSGQRKEMEISKSIEIYNPASETVNISVPGVWEGESHLPELLNGGDGSKFPKFPEGLGDEANALVKLEIAQEATLEREGFEAVLTFSNGLAEDLVGFSVAPRVFDEFNNDVTASFQLVPPTLSGALSATDGSQTLPGSSEFTASWILVPGEGMGGQDPAGKTYFVEAVANYSQGGELRNFQTQSEDITVHPQPSLELFYYLPQKILKNSPFRLGVFVENNGYGDASNFRIASAQPEVVENESGVPVEVEIVGSSFGAGNTETDTWSVELGDVEAQGWARGYWITRCNYDATITEFTAELEHLPYEGVVLNPLITDVHTEIILGDYLFADAIDPNNSFSLIDRDDDGIPDYLLNLYSGFRSEITVPDELRVSHEPTIEEPQMVYSIADTYGFVCMVINDPLSQINIRGIERHHLDGSEDVYELSGNNFWRDGDTLYVVDRIGEIVDGVETTIPVEYVIDYQPMLEVREIQIGNYVFNTLMAGFDEEGGAAIILNGEFDGIWTEDLRGTDDIGAFRYGFKDPVTDAPVPMYDTGLPIIAGDRGSVWVEFYNAGISPESGDVGVYLIDAEGGETLLATKTITNLRSYRTLEMEFPFDTVSDGQYTLEVRFLDGRTEGNASEPIYINARPISDAGPDQIISRGDTVQFDSSRSYDPDGLIIKYEWYMGDFTVDDEGNNQRATWIAGPLPNYTFEDSGTYRILLDVTDYYGAMEEDEMVITVEENRPDIYIESAGHGETTIIDGQEITITAVVNNAGVSLSADESFDVGLYSGSRLLASQKISGGFATGESREVSFTYTANAEDDFLMVIVDDMGNAIDEANEDNNVDAVAIFAEGTDFADLQMKNLRLNVAADQAVGWGQTIQVLADVYNGGLVDAERSFRVTAYVDGEYIGFAHIDSLAVEARSAVAFDWVPTPGTHSIEVIADWPYSYIRESNETNNTASLTVSPANLDLELPNLKALTLRLEPEDGVLVTGIDASVTTTFRNDSLIDLPFGSEAVLRVDGLEVARRSIGAIAAGRSSAVQLFWTNPWKGEHEISVELDPESTWYESDKDDNVLTATHELVFESADLTVERLVVPEDCRTGVEIPLGIQLGNAADGRLNKDFTVKAFINDELVAVSRMEGLWSAGQTRWWTPVWTPDEGVAGSPVQLRVAVDTLDEIPELDEDNNEKSLTFSIADGVETSLSLSQSKALVGDSLNATVSLLDTATQSTLSSGSVELIWMTEEGTEISSQSLSYDAGWHASLQTDSLAAGDYLLRAVAVIDGESYVSSSITLTLVDERLVSCEVPEFVLLSDSLNVSGQVTLSDGTPEVDRGVVVMLETADGIEQYYQAETDASGNYAVSIQTTRALAGNLNLSAAALGADLKGLNFSSTEVTTRVAGLALGLSAQTFDTQISVHETLEITLEAVGMDVSLQAYQLLADESHEDEAHFKHVLNEALELPQTLLEGDSLVIRPELWGDAAIDALSVEVLVDYDLATYGSHQKASSIEFSAAAEKVVEVSCSNVYVYNGDNLERTLPWDEDHHVDMVLAGDRHLFVDVTVTNITDRNLYDVRFEDPAYDWIESTEHYVDTLEPWGSWTVRVEIDTFDPGTGKGTYDGDFEFSYEEEQTGGGTGTGIEIPADPWPFEFTFDYNDPSHLELTCLLQDQYENVLSGHHIVLEPLSTDGSAKTLLTNAEGLAYANLSEGTYAYTVQEGSSYPYRNCEGEIWVAGEGADYEVITVTVDPFGLSLEKTSSTELDTYGEARLGLVLEEEDAPLKLSHPGREYLLLQNTDIMPDAYLDLACGSENWASQQLTLMNKCGSKLNNLRVTVDGSLADYLRIDGNDTFWGTPLTESLIKNANYVVRWEFREDLLRAERERVGEDIILNATLLFSTDEGYEAIFYLCMRVSELAETHNGVPYDYVTYTDWLGRDCPVGMETLPLWMGMDEGTSVDGTEETGLMAGINQTLLASGQSFTLNHSIKNQLPDQSIEVENLRLKILDSDGNDVSASFAFSSESNICGQEIEPLGFVNAEWAVSMIDSSLGGTLAGGKRYTAVFEGATRYGSALIPYEQEIEFTIQPSPELQVNYSFEQTDSRTGILTARVDNNGYGPAYNVTMELPVMSDATLMGGEARQLVSEISPGDTAIFTWELSFSRDIYSTEVLAQLKSLNPLMEGEEGEWVKAPVTHEFRSDHTIDEVIAQVDDLMNALENKIEYEFSELMYVYDDIGNQLTSIKDARQLELMSYRMNSIVNATFQAVDVFQKAKKLVTDAAGMVKKDIKEMTKEIGSNAFKNAFNTFMDGDAPSVDSVMDDVKKKTSEDTGHDNMVKLGDSFTAFNGELVNIINTTRQLAKLHENTLLKFGELYQRAVAGDNAKPSDEEIRSELFYQSVDSAEFLKEIERYYGEHTTLPLDDEAYDFIFDLSRGQTVEGMDPFIETFRMVGRQLKIQLGVLKQSKVSAIFPVDLLYNELRNMTATLVTYDVSAYAQGSDYERKMVETPELENPEETGEAYWYAMGTASPWLTPSMSTAEFGSVQQRLEEAYDHLVWQWDNISYHSELVTKINYAYMQKFLFDSLNLVGGYCMPGMMANQVNPMISGIQQALNMEIGSYQLGLRVANESEATLFDLLCEDVRDFTAAHQQEAGSTWTFMRDFGGHLDYLVANKPIDPELSVEVLSFEIEDAVLSEAGSMSLSSGVISLRNDCELSWSGTPKIKVFSDGLLVQNLTLPDITMEPGEEGIISLVIPQADGQVYGLFGYDYELTFDLWEEDTLSTASCGSWVTSSQAGTDTRLATLSSFGSQPLLDGSFTDDSTWSQTYTAKEDGALRFMMLHNEAAMMDLYVFDEENQMAGFDYDSMEVVCDIPNAQFSGVDSRCQIVTIRNVTAGSQWTVAVQGIDVESKDRVSLTATELPDVPAELFTLNKEYRTVVNNTDAVITALLQEVGGTHGIENVRIDAYSDLVDEADNLLDTDLLVFSFKDSVDVIPAGGSLELGVSVEIADWAVDGLYSMDLVVGGTDAITGEDISYPLILSVDLDRTAPEVPTLSIDPDSSDSDLIVATGTAEADCTVEVWDASGKVLAEVSCGEDGTYQSDPFGLEYGTYEIYAIAKDDIGNESDPSESVFYTETNDWFAPETTLDLNGVLNQSGAYVNAVTIQLTASDSGSGVDKTYISFDDGVTWTEYNTAIIVTEGGSHAIKYYSMDLAGNKEASKYRVFQVSDGSDAPELLPIEDQEIDEEATISFTASVNESDNLGILVYSMSNAPEGANISAASGQFSWTPTNTQGGLVYTVTIQVTDGSHTDSTSVSLTVNDTIGGFAQWAEQIADSTQRGIEDCPAGDKIKNLLKYAIGLDPNVRYSQDDIMSYSEGENNVLMVTYKKSKLATDVSLTPIWTSSLTTLNPDSWTDVIDVAKISETAETETWQARLENDGNDRFILLKVEQQ